VFSFNERKLRGKLGEERISIRSLAKRIGICENSMHRYLAEPERMPYGCILKISEVLSLSQQEMTDLFFGKEE